MGEYEDVVGRLVNHASLPMRSPEARDEESLLYQLWLAEQQKSAPKLGLIDDVVQCLAVLNTHLNNGGLDRASGAARILVPDSVAYSVACMITDCLSYYRRWS